MYHQVFQKVVARLSCTKDRPARLAHSGLDPAFTKPHSENMSTKMRCQWVNSVQSSGLTELELLMDGPHGASIGESKFERTSPGRQPRYFPVAIRTVPNSSSDLFESFCSTDDALELRHITDLALCTLREPSSHRTPRLGLISRKRLTS